MEKSTSDPPPISFAPPPDYPSPPFSLTQPGGNSPTQPQFQLNHPPYEDMIRIAVRALNDKDGSSRQKIARYIETEFHVTKSRLHEIELTHNLKQMKTLGQLVLVRHSYMLPVDPPPPPHTYSSLGPYGGGPSVPPSVQPAIGPSMPPTAGPSMPPSVQPAVGPSMTPGFGPSVQPAVGPSVASYPVSDGSKRRPGRPRKLQPVVVSRTPTPSPPVGFAAFSPKQSGVPTTSLFGGLAPASYQFSAGPSVSTTGLATGSSNNHSTMVPASGPVNSVPTMTIASGPVTTVPSMGPVTTVPSMGPVTVSGPVNNGHSIAAVSSPVNNVPSTGSVNNILAAGVGSFMSLPGLVSLSVSTVPSTSPVSGTVNYSGPVHDEVALAQAGPDVINEVVGNGHQSSAGTLVVSAASDPAMNNDGPLMVVPTGPDSIMLNNEGPSTVLGKRGRGRPPKMNGGLKKMWAKPASYGHRGLRGRPRKLPIPVSTISLRPRGRPRKIDAGGEIVAFDGANDGDGGQALPVANIPLELPDRSLGCPNKDVPDAASLTSEIQLMAYQGLKAKIEYYNTVIKSAVSAIRPSLGHTEVSAQVALQTLEDLTNMDIISVPVNAPSAPAVVQKAPGDNLNSIRIVQGAPVADDLNAPVVQDAATDNIQIVPVQSAAVPAQGQQEPPLQS